MTLVQSMGMKLWIIVALVAVLAMVPTSGNLDGHSTYGFSVQAGATAYLVEAVDSGNIVWGSQSVNVSGGSYQGSLATIKSQLPLSGYPYLTLRATVTAGVTCSCIGAQSTVDILD